MLINYKLGSESYRFDCNDKEKVSKLNFLLTNPKGDFLNLGVESNFCKYHGFNVCKSDTVEYFKFIENVIPIGLEVSSCEYQGNKFVRKFKSEFMDSNLMYSNDEVPEDFVDSANDFFSSRPETQDSFFVGPTGGLVYEINNFDGDLFIDLDLRKKNDFIKSGRDYKVFSKNGRVYVEYTKTFQEGSYKMFFGVFTQNFIYDFVKENVIKHYDFNRFTNSHWKFPVFRLLKAKILNNKKFFFGCGFSLEEVDSQIDLLLKHDVNLEEISNSEISKSVFDRSIEFESPVSEKVLVAYRSAILSNYKFLVSDLDNSKVGVGCFAGFPYFTNVWARDDIFALKSLIDLGEVGLVKSRIDFYLSKIDSKTGSISNLLIRDSNSSCDIVFLLCRRLEDFMHYLIERDELFKVYSLDDLKSIYSKLNLAFLNIVKFNWDFDLELIKAGKKGSFRDNFSVDFPLSFQVLFLSFSSFMAFLAKVCNFSSDVSKFLDFEDLLRSKIRSSYFRGGFLYDDVYSDKVTFSVFYAFYFYPELFSDLEWENVFDNSLMVLKNGWSGVSSLSSDDGNFVLEHSSITKHDSRNRGDSFFYMNNLAAICLHGLNERKYRGVISKILSSSCDDFLTSGTIGFGSELSSSVEQRAEGNLAHLVSTSTFIELVDRVFGRK